MKEEDIKKIHSIIKEEGDSFWQEKDQELLFDEILEMLNKRGVDLCIVEA